MPPVPRIDPASALLRNPEVAEEKRFCSSCGKPVGRAQDGRPGPVEGVCPRDGTPFSFTPKLRPGDLVAGQYDVQGSLAHGGLGWIYLALDRNVENRWVVLKGLVDAAGADAMAAAIAERRYLAQVSHPNIVAIHNFVQHPGEDGTPVGYIVMEYVGGSSLKELLEARRRPDGTLDPMPVPQAIAYALDILPALAHLHALGLAYCDFKPENVIQYDRQLKLIDLGAVIRMDDRRSALFGTVGYQAPEIVADGPSPSSDVYTVGRTLAVLALGISPTHRGAPVELPDPADHPVLAAHESFHRLLRRATDLDPVRRFESTDEMADQLAGVLREVLALTDGEPRPAVSTVFGPARGAFAPDLLIDAGVPGRPDPARVAGALPVPLVDPADEAAALLATATVVDPDEVQRLVDGAAQPSPELRLRLVRAHLDAGDPDAARARARGAGGRGPGRLAARLVPGHRRPRRRRPGGGGRQVRRGLHRVARGGPGEARAGRRGRVRGPGRGRRLPLPAGGAGGPQPGRRPVRAGPGAHPHRRRGRRAARARRRSGVVQPVRGRAARRRAGHPARSRRHARPTRSRCGPRRAGCNGCRWTRPPTTRCAPPCSTRPSGRWTAPTRPPTRSSTVRGRSASCGWRWSGACARRPG